MDPFGPLTPPLELQPGRWYGWQMLPGYTSPGCYRPYFSPIKIEAVTPLKSGRKILRVAFFNMLYAQGVQDFTVHLRILKHQPDYLVAEVQPPTPQQRDRAAIISRIDFEWIAANCPHLRAPTAQGQGDDQNPASVAAYLEARLRL